MEDKTIIYIDSLGGKVSDSVKVSNFIKTNFTPNILIKINITPSISKFNLKNIW